MRRDAQYGRSSAIQRRCSYPLTSFAAISVTTAPSRNLPAPSGKLSQPEQVLDWRGAAERPAGTEALFTLGDKPELRLRTARQMLADSAHDIPPPPLSYYGAMCELVLATKPR